MQQPSSSRFKSQVLSSVCDCSWGGFLPSLKPRAPGQLDPK